MIPPVPPVVLLGTDCMTGLQISRILWRKEIPVIGIADNPKSAYCRTRSAKRTMATSAIRENPLPMLKEIAAQYHARPVLMTCTDDFVWWLNNHREAVGEVADFLIPPRDVLALLTDKARFYRYAMEEHLPLSATRMVSTQEELARAASEMPFPLILKPPRRSTEWMKLSHGLKVLKVESPEELLRIGPALQALDELILQAWVPGPDENMHELFVCFDRQGELLAHLASKKVRQWPLDIGVGALAQETCADGLVEPVLAILKKLRYVGLGHMELKKHAEDGTFYLIEMNTRAALNFPLCEACGIEMIYTHYCSAAGLPLPETRTATRPGSKWICWKTDLASAYFHWKRGDLSVREWWASIQGHKWSADIQLDDPVPLLADLFGKITRASTAKS